MTNRRLARAILTTAAALISLVLLAGTAQAGVPDQRLHDIAEVPYGECGSIDLWFDDHVDFRKPQFWNSTSGEIEGRTTLAFEWHCDDVPPPELPRVVITDTFAFGGRKLDYGAGLPWGVTGSVDSKEEGGLTHERTPELRYDGGEGRSARVEYRYDGVRAQGRNLSVTHEAVAELTWPDGSTSSLSVSDEARD